MTSERLPSLDVRLGYSQVDDQPDITTMVAIMDATATWPAVRQLQAWERERLALQPGDRVLDVGCGPGDVARGFVDAVARGGQVVAVDASDAMLEAARQRAAEAGADVDFRQADATSLDEPDASFDACRSERMLQWLPDPGAAIAEMVRVLRPGGRLCVIDTDWQTLTIDLPDTETVSAFREAVWMLRGAPASVGSQLLNLCRDTGLVRLDAVAATHIWTHWDPDAEEAPGGIASLQPVVDQVVEAGLLDAEVGRRFLDQLLQAARTDRLFMSVGMFAVAGHRPPVEG